MIQRIQTLYLALSALAVGSLFFLPFGKATPTPDGILADGQYTVTDHSALLVMAIAGIILSLLDIFIYKNRPLQARIAFFPILVGIALPVAAYLIYASTTAVAGSSGLTFQAGFFIPMIAVVTGILAIRNIKKDDRLVKSMDRLR